MTLPEDFCKMMKEQLGEKEYQLFAKALDEEPVCSVRMNPKKPSDRFQDEECVPWCESGRYLKERPQFTLDPLFHAGCYYVQEASSMFIRNLLRVYTMMEGPMVCLDLCAAPGGKSTLLLDFLPEGSWLFANEPIRQRASILKENIVKWGNPNVIVTSNYAKDFQPLGPMFDLILCDAPCSGEGMFRKDADSIGEWSMNNVMMCQKRQREIIRDIWDNLREGGLFIYSTCTYNHYEDEDNVKWIAEELGADILPYCAEKDWGIVDGHFYPHRTKGEGFYVAILQKDGERPRCSLDAKKIMKNLHILLNGVEPGRVVDRKGTVEPSQSEAMTTASKKMKQPQVELSLNDALQYLRGESLTLSADAPKGYVLLTYEGHPLGFCKNIGSRANNLYPAEWRIKKKL